MRALLDINVLLALLDADHIDHQRAQEWISGEIQHGWASCALTQNGFVRILSQLRYSALLRFQRTQLSVFRNIAPKPGAWGGVLRSSGSAAKDDGVQRDQR